MGVDYIEFTLPHLRNQDCAPECSIVSLLLSKVEQNQLFFLPLDYILVRLWHKVTSFINRNISLKKGIISKVVGQKMHC